MATDEVTSLWNFISGALGTAAAVITWLVKISVDKNNKELKEKVAVMHSEIKNLKEEAKEYREETKEIIRMIRDEAKENRDDFRQRITDATTRIWDLRK